jgi:hypothetical protein
MHAIRHIMPKNTYTPAGIFGKQTRMAVNNIPNSGGI